MIKKLSIIIVSYNCQEFIENCINSVLKNLPKNSEIIVLDNDSKDGTYLRLQNFSSKIKLIKSDQNLGFSKGNNKAAKLSSGEYLFFLNPDTEILGRDFKQLLEFYKKTPNVGIVAPKLMMENGEIQESVKHFPTIWGAVKELIFGIKNSYTQYVPKENYPIQVDSVYGAAMLIKSELFWEVGGFDEKFFLYYEDLDLCERLSQIGKTIYYFPGVKIRHLIGASKTKQNRYELNYESFIKYHGKFKAFIYQAIFIVPRIKRRFFSSLK